MDNVPNAVESFSEGLARLIAYAAREQDTFVPYHHQEDYFGFGKWVEDIREPGLVLTEEQRSKIESVARWTWQVQYRREREESQSNFEESLELLEAYVKANDTARVPQMIDGQTTPLGHWVKKMRDQFKNGELSNAQVKRILQYRGWTWDDQYTNFLENLGLYKTFQAQNPGRSMPRSYKVGDVDLGGWFHRTRATLAKDAHKHPKRVLRVVNVPGWEIVAGA